MCNCAIALFGVAVWAAPYQLFAVFDDRKGPDQPNGASRQAARGPWWTCVLAFTGRTSARSSTDGWELLLRATSCKAEVAAALALQFMDGPCSSNRAMEPHPSRSARSHVRKMSLRAHTMKESCKQAEDFLTS